LPENAVLINIQGDEPTLDPEALSLLAGAFCDPQVQAATLAHPLDPADLTRADKVKVVLALSGDALYFSRAGIPFSRDGERALPAYGHIGLYAFTMHTLSRFVALPPSPLERTEKLEQLRLLENNIPIRVLLTDTRFIGVDQAEDVDRVLPLLQ
jgi:3-deoxy-manno-octulosonate cytidylyltransferase (CMP-KDO synthetase)